MRSREIIERETLNLIGRLVVLSNLPESVFLKSNVYPALKYYLRRGDEGLCRKEIEKLLSQLEV